MKTCCSSSYHGSCCAVNHELLQSSANRLTMLMCFGFVQLSLNFLFILVITSNTLRSLTEAGAPHSPAHINEVVVFGECGVIIKTRRGLLADQTST